MGISGQFEGVESVGGTTGPDVVTPGEAERRRAAVELIRGHRTLLMASARRFALCREDAEDAFQRGMEIVLTKAPTSDPRQLLPWARTVIRNEALAIRKARERTLARPTADRTDEGDPFDSLPAESGGPHEALERAERVARTREGLSQLKPQELKALTQLGVGLSYAEIARRNGWTRTKVNRCLAEGREKLRSVVRASAAGERCALVEPLVSSLVDGELEADRIGEVRDHLASCGSCRAVLREYRQIPFRVAALSPLPLVGIAGSEGSMPREGFVSRLVERLDELSAQAAARFGSLFPGADPATGTLIGQTTRGLGGTALAKAVAICLGTAGGAAVCVGSGVVPAIGEPERAVERPVTSRPIAAPDPVPGPVGEVDPARPPGEESPDGGGETAPPLAPPPDPVVAEFSPGAEPAASPSPTPSVQPSRPASPVPLGGSREFGP